MALEEWESQHNKIIDQIDKIMENHSHTPYELSRAEWLYTKAEKVTWHIVGHYKAEFKYYEAMAEQMQARGYEKIRKGEAEGFEEKFKSAQDAQYMSRLTKGLQLEKASKAEGLYDRWRGVAGSYQNACNAVKDMIKTVQKEGG